MDGYACARLWVGGWVFVSLCCQHHCLILQSLISEGTCLCGWVWARRVGGLGRVCVWNSRICAFVSRSAFSIRTSMFGCVCVSGWVGGVGV